MKNIRILIMGFLMYAPALIAITRGEALATLELKDPITAGALQNKYAQVKEDLDKIIKTLPSDMAKTKGTGEGLGSYEAKKLVAKEELQKVEAAYQYLRQNISPTSQTTHQQNKTYGTYQQALNAVKVTYGKMLSLMSKDPFNQTGITAKRNEWDSLVNGINAYIEEKLNADRLIPISSKNIEIIGDAQSSIFDASKKIFYVIDLLSDKRNFISSEVRIRMVEVKKIIDTINANMHNLRTTLKPAWNDFSDTKDIKNILIQLAFYLEQASESLKNKVEQKFPS